MKSLSSKFRFISSLLSGWRTKEKIVVIESDDWGAVRMPEAKKRSLLAEQGVDVNANPYLKYDILEDQDDLCALFEALTKVRQQIGKSPMITANFIMTNPDFPKIRADDFESYYFETFLETYYRRDGNDRVWGLIQEGVSNRWLRPQFHGREHLNVGAWLKLLREKHPVLLKAFQQECFGVDIGSGDSFRSNLMASYDYTEQPEEKIVEDSILEGLEIFQDIFGYASASMIAPRLVWNDFVESIFAKNEVNIIQGALVQFQPEKEQYKPRYHYVGERNRYGQVYLVRNAFFEPSYSEGVNWVEQVLSKAKIIFALGKPLIISMHRLNFVGGLSERNRKDNLSLFTKLIIALAKKYPEVKFMSSDELGKKILA